MGIAGLNQASLELKAVPEYRYLPLLLVQNSVSFETK